MIVGLGRLLTFEGSRRNHCKLQVSRHSLRTVPPHCSRFVGCGERKIESNALGTVFLLKIKLVHEWYVRALSPQVQNGLKSYSCRVARSISLLRVPITRKQHMAELEKHQCKNHQKQGLRINE